MNAQDILKLFDHPIDTIVLMEFGSHLYGTATEESDHDFKGVFLPTVQEALLGRIPKAYHYSSKKGNQDKNTEKDVDVEIYSLHYFVELACQGQTVALDMVHAPGGSLLDDTYWWQKLTAQRQHFYTSNIKAFVGYAQAQAAKYGIKGSRMGALKKVIEFLRPQASPFPMRLHDLWDDLPEGEHIHKHDVAEDVETIFKMYEVCGRKFHATAKVDYVYPILKRIYDNYGERAKKAEKNEGIDWKAVSHALRAALEVKELLTEGTITFPLKEARLIQSVKQGSEPWSYVQSMLEHEIEQVKQLSEESGLPKKCNRKFWDDFIVKAITQHHKMWYLGV